LFSSVRWRRSPENTSLKDLMSIILSPMAMLVMGLIAHWNKRSLRYEPNPCEETSLSFISFNNVLAKRDLILLASDNLCWVWHLEADSSKVFQNPFHYLLYFSRSGLPARRNTVSCFGYGMGQFYYDCRLFFTAPPAVSRPFRHLCGSCSRRGSVDENLVHVKIKGTLVLKQFKIFLQIC